MNTLLGSSKYKTFTQERNQALEKIHLNAQLDLSRMLFEVLDRVTGFISHMAIQDQMSLNHFTFLVKQLDQYLDHQFHPLLSQIERRVRRMKKNVFVITYLAELEAIARATKRTKPLNSMDFKQKIQARISQDPSKQIWVSLTNLKYKIVRAFQKALVREDSPKEIVDSVKNAYPFLKEYKRPPRALKPIRESNRNKEEENKREFEFYSGLTRDEDWDLAVKAYQDAELPPSRFDYQAKMDPEAGYLQYDWEVEQDMTDEFVSQVRDGQVEAAKELGVEEFVWVAIIDKKTCDVCCLPRNGKTTSEIEAMLASGELDADACDSSVPPAHPSCRCDIAPVASTDEVEGPDWKSFGEWLES